MIKLEFALLDLAFDICSSIFSFLLSIEMIADGRKSIIYVPSTFFSLAALSRILSSVFSAMGL